MLRQRFIESIVGLFLIFTALALSILAFKVSGLTSLFPDASYHITADFDEIGGLKVRAPVKIGGVQIGEVSDIALDPATFKAVVTLAIRNQYRDIPDDSSAGIFTAGLLGDNYIAITPMYNTTFLKEGGHIEITRSAMVLEKLIGQFLYKVGNSGQSDNSNSNKQSEKGGQQ
ncbi:MAG TPA: outer membrane lipid asymmetry maintenance protein MlaD [Gammaproteobacteria bacterium]|jgi:phospholipid/cholesterol/gamma-HCH transport system substrate-binding protein|nr:outer membrane lipid asymmetry maintenance protein MlaD [Gammaproteobacteria bacterium]